MVYILKKFRRSKVPKRGLDILCDFSQPYIDLPTDELYDKIRNATVSQNCISAGDDYLKLIAPICPVREDVAHSLMRIAMRPFFYAGIGDVASMMENINHASKGNLVFLEWVNINEKLVSLIIIELTICCLFYGGFSYDSSKDVVVFSYVRDEYAPDVLDTISVQNIYKVFKSFDEFRVYFYSLFDHYEISQVELDRIMLEEGYETLYYACKANY